jgi:hypothetical protein
MATFEELVLKNGGTLRPTSELSAAAKAALLDDLLVSGSTVPTLVAQFPSDEAANAFEAECQVTA